MSTALIQHLHCIQFEHYLCDRDAICWFQINKLQYQQYYPLYVFKHRMNAIPLDTATRIIPIIQRCYNLQSIAYLSKFQTPVKEILLHDQFNESLIDLPNTVEELTTGRSFNQSIEHLPNSLLKLTLGADFNHPIDSLPDSIQYLILAMHDYAHQIHPCIKACSHSTATIK